MQTIETRVRVGDDRTLLMQLPDNVPTGDYEVVLVLNQRSEDSTMGKPDTAIQRVRASLKQSIEPGYSLADELIRERREAAKNE